jgi:isopenicillin N synthase-like dioxygenase
MRTELTNIEVILKDLSNSGYSRIEQPLISKQDFINLNDSFQFLREILGETKLSLAEHNLKTDKSHNYGELGFKKRTDENDDTKYFFHYNPYYDKLVNKNIENILEKEIYDYFLTNIKSNYNIAENYAREFLSNYSKEIQNHFIHPKSNKMMCFYRLLEYPYQNNDSTKNQDKPLANMHTDAGAFTFAFDESHSGLEIAAGENEYTSPIEHIENKLVLMPGRNFESYNLGNIEASNHQVKKSIQEDEKSRFANVFLYGL